MRPAITILLCLAAGTASLRVASNRTRDVPQARALLIERVTVVSPERAASWRDATVLVRDGRIAWIGDGSPPGLPSDAERIDGRGRFLVPGFIDGHVHVGHAPLFTDAHHDERADLVELYHAQVPRSYLHHGFTTLVDPDLSARTIARFARQPIAPRLVGCGRGLRYFEGYGPAFFPDSVRYAVFPAWIHDSAQARTLPSGTDIATHAPEHLVPRAVADGARCIKTYHESGFGGVFDWPVPSSALLARTVRAAHAHGVPIMLHATGLDAYRAGIASNVDVLAHGLWHWPGVRLDPTPPAEVAEVIRDVARQGISVQPTLRVLAGEQDTFGWRTIDDPRLAEVFPSEVLAWLRTAEGRWPQRESQALYRRLLPDSSVPAERYMEAMNARARATSHLMLEAGVTLLFGSDTPASDGIGNPPGLNGTLEIHAWWEAGVPPREILRALTIGGAERFGLAGEIGSIEVGKRADLVLLARDPLETPNAYDAIETVILGGAPIPRSELSARRLPPPARP